MTQNYQSYLFNFSSSYFGGGLKRILAYLRWFNERGGACFVLNHRLKGIEKTFPANRYCFLRQHPISKVLNYSRKFNLFVSEIEKINFYYSYGIPLVRNLGRINWIHIANVLPFVNSRQYVSLKRSLELQLLGFLINKSTKYADIVSAESQSSLNLLDTSHQAKLVVSVNGSDEEIAAYDKKNTSQTENVAVAVGTCQYKSIDDVYTIYLHLRQSNPDLCLVIAGIKEDVPAYIQKDNQVILRGVLSQLQVCDLLKNAKYYITATLIENSYNAASEGIFLARESFVSDIGPHRELLKNLKHQVISNLGTQIGSLYIKQEDLNVNNLKSWDQVISEMVNITQEIPQNS
jgi:glycosyltransferase involved in cell wall biosynthesis